MYGSWDMVCDGQIDKQLEKVTYKGGCPTLKMWKTPMEERYFW